MFEGECNYVGIIFMKWCKDLFVVSSCIIYELLLWLDELLDEFCLICGKIMVEFNVVNVILGCV